MEEGAKRRRKVRKKERSKLGIYVKKDEGKKEVIKEVTIEGMYGLKKRRKEGSHGKGKEKVREQGQREEGAKERKVLENGAYLLQTRKSGNMG